MSEGKGGSGKPKIMNRVFAGFGGVTAMHPALPMILIGLLGALAVLLLIASILLWPILIRACAHPAEGGGNALPVVIAGGAGLLISAAINLTLAYKQEEFTFAGAMAVSYIFCLIACAVGMIVGGLQVLSPIIGQSAGSGYLSFCMQLVFSLMIAMVPAFVASLIAVAFRFFGHLYLDLRS